MILELTYARGMRLWIDGQLPTAKHWSITRLPRLSEIDDAPLETAWEFSTDGSPLEIGGLRVTGLKTDCPFCDTYDGHTPTSLVLMLEGGAELTFKVTNYAWGDHDEEEPTNVTLVNGETIEIDEITLYLRAESMRLYAPLPI